MAARRALLLGGLLLALGFGLVRPGGALADADEGLPAVDPDRTTAEGAAPAEGDSLTGRRPDDELTDLLAETAPQEAPWQIVGRTLAGSVDGPLHQERWTGFCAHKEMHRDIRAKPGPGAGYLQVAKDMFSRPGLDSANAHYAYPLQ